jgi:hypothetical protein
MRPDPGERGEAASRAIVVNHVSQGSTSKSSCRIINSRYYPQQNSDIGGNPCSKRSCCALVQITVIFINTDPLLQRAGLLVSSRRRLPSPHNKISADLAFHFENCLPHPSIESCIDLPLLMRFGVASAFVLATLIKHANVSQPILRMGAFPSSREKNAVYHLFCGQP